jgi:REP element-mobilizing transposase RayT
VGVQRRIIFGYAEWIETVSASWRSSFRHVLLLSPSGASWDAPCADLFERSLEPIRLRHQFFVTGYVVMPEHVHLFVSEPLHGTLARALRAFKLSVAVQSRERPFWQRRYYDFNVHSEQKRVEKLRHMHRNPVVRRIGGKAGRLEMVELPPLCERLGRPSGNRVILDSSAKRRPSGLVSSLPYDDDLPDLKIEIWGTQTNLTGKVNESDLGHPPLSVTNLTKPKSATNSFLELNKQSQTFSD